MSLFKLKNCVDESLPILEENNSCIVLPYNAKIQLIHANRTYHGSKNSWIMNEEIRDVNSVKEAKNHILLIYNERGRLNGVLRECEESLEIIKNSNENQKPICDMRNQIIILLKLSEALALIFLGFIIYGPIKEWIEK